ncbi:MAG: sigma-70 family RNA polymerase sigma factor [Flavobacteriales bacterium]|nr:sigma-70 family RNA polymerase sigma factor [Flavobacteriales bacterium]
MRYMGNENDANDVFQDGFIKIFDNLKRFRQEGSFEGWAKRIMVNMALMHIRKRRPLGSEVDLDTTEPVSYDQEILSKMSADELMQLVQELPDGYREVFSLFGIEGYNHREIAEMLGISEGNSKLRMNRARKMLQQRVIELMQVA